ncbi:putative UDP-glucuronosyl/UDP-glucosyltransferase [Lupinus albus]|uniref:Putative UDP-glucuronosyl/UDP-glucosyltransferase n=1 Tax=Lupinus albus TaxID=3870 RepID=A0A6A4P6D8_LUPAL|nr:putative UDP-glucuronosyl/UDP-glucosyltransferase [Lupinus albus]
MEERIVLYPSPGIGHIISMVELAKHLLKQNHHHYSITLFLTTGFLDHPSIDSYINSISTSHPSISFLRLPFLPSSAASTTVSFAATAFEFIRNNADNVASSLNEICESCVVKGFVIDMFCTSALSVGCCMGIPVYYFFTSGAAALALCCYLPKIHHQTNHSFKDLQDELQIPGNAPLKAFHMPEPVLDRNDAAYWDMLYFCKHLPKSNGIIVNSFEELEPFAVKAIKEGLSFPDPTQIPPIYYIGPLIAEANDPSDKQNSGVETNSYLSWLKNQPKRSVIYLCFGSRGSFSITQLKEIANGLEKSEQRFLWVVKTPTQDEGTKQVHDTTTEFNLSSVLPNGFLDRTKNKGIVVRSWVPQVEVLSHESVGGFVSHCGWNSVLEGVVAGVPMIA